jgi:alpha-glucosidase (family GH31 glycosyl hydrolase)
MADPINGGTTVTTDHSADLQKVPLYFRSGAIIPMQVADDITGFGTAESSGKLTVLVFPGTTPTSFPLHDTDDALTQIQTTTQNKVLSVMISRTLVDTLVRIRVEAKPTSVTVNGTIAMERADRAAFDAASSGYFHETATRSIWVKIAANTKESSVQIQLP